MEEADLLADTIAIMAHGRCGAVAVGARGAGWWGWGAPRCGAVVAAGCGHDCACRGGDAVWVWNGRTRQQQVLRADGSLVRTVLTSAVPSCPPRLPRPFRRLAALGTSLQLKAQFGVGYTLTLSRQPDGNGGPSDGADNGSGSGSHAGASVADESRPGGARGQDDAADGPTAGVNSATIADVAALTAAVRQHVSAAQLLSATGARVGEDGTAVGVVPCSVCVGTSWHGLCHRTFRCVLIQTGMAAIPATSFP